MQKTITVDPYADTVDMIREALPLLSDGLFVGIMCLLVLGFVMKFLSAMIFD